MTINQIFSNDEISERAFTTCIDNDVENIFELKEYYKIFGDFKLYKNCGYNTNIELISICEKYLDLNDSFENHSVVQKPITLQKEISPLTDFKKVLIDDYITNQLSKLSPRSINALKKYLNGKINIDDISKKIFSNPNFKILSINSIGTKSFRELDEFINNIKNVIIQISDESDDFAIMILNLTKII